MRILYASHWFLPYSLAIVNALAKNHEVCLVTTHRALRSVDPDRARELLDPDIRVEIEPDTRERQTQPPGYYVASLRSLRRLIREFRPDVIHVQETTDPMLAWVWLRALSGTSLPFVVTVHDPEPHLGDTHKFWWVRQRMIQSIRRRADQVVALAEYNRQALLAMHEFLTPDRVGLAYHPVMEFYREFVPPEAERRPGTILFFGRMVKYKGLDTLIEAWETIRASNPDARLIVAGRGPDLPQYLPVLEADDRVEVYATFLPNGEVARLFTEAEVVVLPYREATQSGVLATALAFGSACVTTDVGGLGEMVKQGKSALLVPPGDPKAVADAVLSVLEDGSLRERLEAGARERAAGPLSGAQVAAQLEEIYQRAISAKSQAN
ncbi:MAG: hypothetical protein KatS3mg015_2718 [Fimbriimonadales bacterium]|nr:MAG: hypothetical protein KatS3mg015_2718 [Fimbriimonadales bacterium]